MTTDVALKFSIPKDGQLFTRDVYDRCSGLIASGIWGGVTSTEFRRWINNFRTEEERYFSARILDALIYRSKDQTVALMNQLFERTIPDGLRDDTRVEYRPDGWLIDLRGRRMDPGIRLVPVAGPEEGPPTKSGGTVARMYTHDVGVNARWVIWPSEISTAIQKGVRTFAFIDDFLGTGTQFGKFAERHELHQWAEECTLVFSPLAAHETGIARLNRELSWLHICAVEKLDKGYGLFSGASKAFEDGVNNCIRARQFYFDLLRSRGLNYRFKFAAGYGRLALTYVFEHATPNNCLPLLWHRYPGWEPMFRR
jgi:hypothetical protein